MRTPIGLIASLLALLIAPSTGADGDHMKCFKVRDGLKRQPYTADLSGLVPQPGCTVSVPALFACVPSDETSVQPPPSQVGGGAPTGGFACYRVRCPKAVLPSMVLEEGSRPPRLFWGYDSFPHLERALRGEDPLDPAEVVRWQSRLGSA